MNNVLLALTGIRDCVHYASRLCSELRELNGTHQRYTLIKVWRHIRIKPCCLLYVQIHKLLIS